MATIWVATNGSDSSGDGSSGSPYRQINRALKAISGGGNEIIVRPGSYAGADLGTAPDGTSGAKNILRAEFPRVTCNGDVCSVNTSQVSELTGDLILAVRHHWIIEGLKMPVMRTNGTHSTRISSLEWRYNEIGGNHGRPFATVAEGINGANIHHNLFTDTSISSDPVVGGGKTPHIDYGIRAGACTGMHVHNNVFRGSFHHFISYKRNVQDIHDHDNIFLGGEFDVIFIGQNHDDTGANSIASPGEVVCGDEDTRNSTSVNILFERFFISDAQIGERYHRARYPIRIDNVKGCVVRYGYLQRTGVDGNANFMAIAVDGTTGQDKVTSGESLPRSGDVDIYGNTIVWHRGAHPIWIRGRGTNRDRIRIFNNTIAHNSGLTILRTANMSRSRPCAQTTTLSGTDLEWYNNNVSVAGSAFNIGGSGLAITQEDNNNWHSAGGTRGGAGTVSVSPSFVGPTTQPGVPSGANADLPPVWTFDGAMAHYLGANGKLRWSYQGGSPLIGAGRAVPPTDILGNPISFFASSPAIGSHNFLVSGAPPPATWINANVFVANAPLWRGDITPPWVSGRGLVIRLSRAAKQLVVGIGSDPLDPASFATDVWIHKAAFLQLKRNKVAIELQAGTEGAEEDGSGAAWRTRAVFHWTDPVEHVVGFWVRYEIAAAPHRVSATTAWAWQGVQRADGTA
jgi:hypothetical protein